MADVRIDSVDVRGCAYFEHGMGWLNKLLRETNAPPLAELGMELFVTDDNYDVVIETLTAKEGPLIRLGSVKLTDAIGLHEYVVAIAKLRLYICAYIRLPPALSSVSFIILRYISDSLMLVI